MNPNHEHSPAVAVESVPHLNGTHKPRDEVWDTIEREFYPEGVPRRMAARVGAVVRDLKDMNATPETIGKRVRKAHELWPGKTFTPEAIVKHWGALGGKVAPEGFLDRFGLPRGL